MDDDEIIFVVILLVALALALLVAGEGGLLVVGPASVRPRPLKGVVGGAIACRKLLIVGRIEGCGGVDRG
jgi:hypothetical protein